jgi:hypothetical protein
LTQIILFLEMLKFSKNIFLKEKMLVKESEEYIFGIFWIFFSNGIFQFIYLFIYSANMCSSDRGPIGVWVF